MDLNQRCEAFVRAGLLPVVPTRWQTWQGTLEMTPYVMSTDATEESRYQGAVFGHPLARQPIIISQVGLDWFRSGPALGSRCDSVCRHLHFTYHQGMPVFDLQLLQTYSYGLERMRAETEELLANSTPWARRTNRLVGLILPDASEYFERFLGTHGWIERAARFDYPGPSAEGAAFPREYFSLIDFLNYCAQRFPASPADTPWHRMPGHLYSVVSRRFREGKRFGWFDEPVTQP